MDDARASEQLARMMRDGDASVVQAAISASYNGGEAVETSLASLVKDPGVAQNLKVLAANQLRNRGADLDPTTEQLVTKLAGSSYGGDGYGHYYRDYED
jgi:hypothetical protein